MSPEAPNRVAEGIEPSAPASSPTPNNRNLPLLGFALLLACSTAGLWLAAGFVLPSALYVMQLHGTQIPTFFDAALRIQPACFYSVYPIALTGVALFVIAILRRGPPALASTCRRTFAILSGLVACLSLYLLSSGGIAFKLASNAQMVETKFYKRILDQFALRETAEGRYEKFREVLRNTRDMKMVEVRSASEFSDAETRERVSAHIGALREASDVDMKRRILSTLSLFRERIRKDSYEARDISRHATEAGAPPTSSHGEALQWIATNLHKDGWEPLPLFKLTR